MLLFCSNYFFFFLYILNIINKIVAAYFCNIKKKRGQENKSIKRKKMGKQMNIFMNFLNYKTCLLRFIVKIKQKFAYLKTSFINDYY